MKRKVDYVYSFATFRQLESACKMGIVNGDGATGKQDKVNCKVCEKRLKQKGDK